jgi:hypothetical protein
MLANGQAHPLTRFEHEVAEVVVARQPDAALEHREFAAQAAELQRVTSGQALGRGPIELRIHHQSPVGVP